MYIIWYAQGLIPINEKTERSLHMELILPSAKALPNTNKTDPDWAMQLILIKNT